MKSKKVWKVNIAVAVILLISIGALCWIYRSGVILSKYEYKYTTQNLISPDGQYQVKVLVLGKEEEDGSFSVDYPVNESYDMCVELWFDPEIQSDGSIMWHDVNTKIIYFQKDCIELDVEWVDHDTVMVDGKEIDMSPLIVDFLYINFQ